MIVNQQKRGVSLFFRQFQRVRGHRSGRRVGGASAH